MHKKLVFPLWFVLPDEPKEPSATGSMAAVNPIRYRGYYYDTETELYYLQSRYYDSGVKRFVNADALVSTGQGFVGFNMFAYCLNCPVIYGDDTGHDAYILIDDQAAGTAGHIGIIVQDEEGNWWHFYWGPKNLFFGICSISGKNVPLLTWCRRIELGEAITLDAINESGQYGGEYDDMLYLEGDFSGVISTAQALDGEYNLYTRNCAQISLALLMIEDSSYDPILEAGFNQLLPILKQMFAKMKSLMQQEFTFSNGAGGSGRDTIVMPN